MCTTVVILLYFYLIYQQEMSTLGLQGQLTAVTLLLSGGSGDLKPLLHLPTAKSCRVQAMEAGTLIVQKICVDKIQGKCTTVVKFIVFYWYLIYQQKMGTLGLQSELTAVTLLLTQWIW